GDLLSNVFTFSDRIVSEIMVPRSKMEVIDLRDPPEDAMRRALETGHSRYPLIDGDADEVVGVVHLKDMLPQLVEGQVPDLRQIARRPLFVPASLSAQRLVQVFQRQRTHLAFVLDEYGSVAG